MNVRVLLPLVLLGCAGGGSDPVTTTDAVVDTATDASVEDVSPEVAAETSADAACSLVKPYSSKDKVCNACAQEKCCAEVNGCLGDTRCDDDYVNCILACALFDSGAGDAGTAACLADCGSKYPAGKTAYDAAIGCVETRCSTVCK